MLAKLCARIALIPVWERAIGACSRLEPQPKLLPATRKSPCDTFSGKLGSIPSIACFASSLWSCIFRYGPGIITSVSMLSMSYLWTLPLMLLLPLLFLLLLLLLTFLYP